MRSMQAERKLSGNACCCSSFGLQAVYQVRQQPNRREILRRVIVVADFNVKSLFAECAQIHESDRVQTYNGPESVIQADIILGNLDE
jgi:hypothetical protein